MEDESTDEVKFKLTVTHSDFSLNQLSTVTRLPNYWYLQYKLTLKLLAFQCPVHWMSRVKLSDIRHSEICKCRYHGYCKGKNNYWICTVKSCTRQISPQNVIHLCTTWNY